MTKVFLDELEKELSTAQAALGRRTKKRRRIVGASVMCLAVIAAVGQLIRVGDRSAVITTADPTTTTIASTPATTPSTAPQTEGWETFEIEGFGAREGATYATGDKWFFAWGGFPDRSPERPTSSLILNIETGQANIVPLSPPLEPHQNAAAIWTGQDFIVFGGRDDSQSFGTGAKFNPIDRDWRPIAVSPFDPGSAVRTLWAQDRMYTWMSEPGDQLVPRSGPGQFASYTPKSDTWELLDPPPVSAVGAELVEKDGRILFIGGPPMQDIGTAGFEQPIQVAEFDTANRTWKLLAEIVSDGEATRTIGLQQDLYVLDDSGTATPIDPDKAPIKVPTDGCWYDIATAYSNTHTYLKACGNVYRYQQGTFQQILSAEDPETTSNTFGSAFEILPNGTLLAAGQDTTSQSDFFLRIFRPN